MARSLEENDDQQSLDIDKASVGHYYEEGGTVPLPTLVECKVAEAERNTIRLGQTAAENIPDDHLNVEAKKPPLTGLKRKQIIYRLRIMFPQLFTSEKEVDEEAIETLQRDGTGASYYDAFEQIMKIPYADFNHSPEPKYDLDQASARALRLADFITKVPDPAPKSVRKSFIRKTHDDIARARYLVLHAQVESKDDEPISVSEALMLVEMINIRLDKLDHLRHL